MIMYDDDGNADDNDDNYGENAKDMLDPVIIPRSMSPGCAVLFVFH